MAGIKEPFEIVDRATAPLNKISSAFNGAASSAEMLGGSADSVASSLDGIGASVDRISGIISGGFSRVVAVLEDISARVGGVNESVSRMASGASAGIDHVETSATDLSGSLSDAGNAAERMGESADGAGRRMTNSLDKTTRSADGLLSRLKGIALALGGLKVARGIIDLSDELTLTQARLNNVNDGLQTTAELQRMIYESAQRSRGSYTGMMQTVANLKAQTGDTFSSVREAVVFTELLQKQFKIAGTDATGIASTMYNLTQALSTGVLRGQDLNIVMSNAPQIAQRIAKQMGVTVGKLKEIAEKGQITSNVVKQAMIGSAQDINEQFDKMPMTINDAVQRLQNMAVNAFAPIGQVISDAINSGGAEEAINALGTAFYFVARVGAVAIGILSTGIQTLTGGLITASGHVGFLGNVFIWLSGLVVMVAAMIQNAFNNVANSIITAAEMIQNGWATMTYNIATSVLNFASGAVRAFSNVVKGAGSAANAIARAFVNGANVAIGGINKLIEAINKIPGVNIGGISELAAPGDVAADITGALDGVAAALDAMKPDAPTLKMYERIPATTMRGAGEAGRNAGQDWAKSVLEGMNASSQMGDFGSLLNGIEQNTANALPGGGNVGKVGKVGKVDEVKLSDEDLKVYRDLAERRYMNNIELKTLAPEINVTLPAGVSGNLSAQDVADRLKKMLIEQMAAQTAVAHG